MDIKQDFYGYDKDKNMPSKNTYYGVLRQIAHFCKYLFYGGRKKFLRTRESFIRVEKTKSENWNLFSPKEASKKNFDNICAVFSDMGGSKRNFYL